MRIYTTLPLSPEELHQTGLEQVAALEARAVELGAALGLSGLDEVFAALRDSAGKMPPEEAIRQAAAAVQRAEARAAEFFPAPLPPPCDVTPMPEVVAVSGAAPHYTPPRLDGGRPGTLAYLTGKLEILRIREEAERRLGPAFSLPAFHAAVLDHGSLPMPALDGSITGWLDRVAP